MDYKVVISLVKKHYICSFLVLFSLLFLYLQHAFSFNSHLSVVVQSRMAYFMITSV